jgi:hypothetical protein
MLTAYALYWVQPVGKPRPRQQQILNLQQQGTALGADASTPAAGAPSAYETHTQGTTQPPSLLLLLSYHHHNFQTGD